MTITRLLNRNFSKITFILLTMFLTYNLSGQVTKGTGYYKMTAIPDSESYDTSILERIQKTFDSLNFVVISDSTTLVDLKLIDDQLFERTVRDFKNDVNIQYNYEYEGEDTSVIYNALKLSEAPERSFLSLKSPLYGEVNVETNDSIYSIQGYNCKRYVFSYSEMGEMFYYVTDQIKLPVYQLDDFKDFNSRYIVQIEYKVDELIFFLKLVEFIPEIVDQKFLSIDTGGMYTIQEYVMQQIEKRKLTDGEEDVVPQGNGTNIEIAKALFEKNLLFDFYWRDIERGNIDSDHFGLLSKIKTDAFNDIADSLEIKLLEAGVISQDLFNKYKQQFQDPATYTSEASMFYLRTQLLLERLNHLPSRIMLVNNLKTSGLLGVPHVDDTDQKFIDAKIDLSEYLIELGYMRSYPGLGYYKTNNDIRNMITQYLQKLFPDLESQIKVELNERDSNTDFVIKISDEQYKIKINRLITYDYIPSEELEDEYTMVRPDSFMIDGDFYSKIDEIVVQIAVDQGNSIQIRPVITAGLLDKYRYTGVREYILAEHPEWKIFKHEYGVLVSDKVSDISASNSIPAFVLMQEGLNYDFIQEFRVLNDYFLPKYLTSKQKRDLKILGETFKLPDEETKEYIEYSLGELLTKYQAICRFLTNSCKEFTPSSKGEIEEVLKSHSAFKEAFPDEYDFFQGDFNAINLKYDSKREVLTMEYEGEILKIVGFRDIKYEMISTISNKMKLKGKEAFAFIDGYAVKMIYMDQQTKRQLEEILDLELNFELKLE